MNPYRYPRPAEDVKVNKGLQGLNGYATPPGLYYLSMAALLLILALLSLAQAPAHGEDEPFDPQPKVSDKKKSTEDIDLFLKGLNEATDEDAQLAEARESSSEEGVAKKKALVHPKKHKRAKRAKEASNDN